MGKYTQAGRPISIRFPNLEPDALLLEKLSGTEAISEPFHFDLNLLAEAEVDFDKLLGESATITLALANGAQRRINGVIRRVCVGGRVPGPLGRDTFFRYRAELVPALWLLSQRVQSRIFQHRSVADILAQILHDEWQLDVSFTLVGTYKAHTYRVQYRESDLAFVSRLMEEEGICYYFEHTEQKHALSVTDDHSLLPELAAHPSVAYDAVQGGQRAAPRIRDWEKFQELRPYKYASRDYCFELPDHELTKQREVGDDRTVKAGKVTHKLGHQRTINGVPMLEVYEYPGGIAHRYDGIDKDGADSSGDLANLTADQDRLAQVRIQQELSRSLSIEGAGDCAHFLPGHKFKLEKHFSSESPPGDGDSYLLTRVEHSANLEGAYTTEAIVNLVYENRFRCVPAALPYRPARVTPRPRIEGTQTAVVIGPAGDEIHCDKYGRVKVRFHWDRDPHDKGDSSCWVRVSQPWAGQTWGALTLPRVGQEVVIGFEEGDPDRPLIQGSLYNAQQMPPYQLPDQRRQSGLVSSSGTSPEKYHEIRLDDTPGSELLHIHSEKDMNHEAENDHTFSVGKDQRIKVNHDHNVQVGNNHNLMVTGDHNIVVGDHLRIHVGTGGGSGGGGGAEASASGFQLGSLQGKWHAENVVVGNMFFFFLGARDEFRLGEQLNVFVGPQQNISVLIPPQLNLQTGSKATFGTVTDLRANAGSLTQAVTAQQDVRVSHDSVAVSRARQSVSDDSVAAVRSEDHAAHSQVSAVHSSQDGVRSAVAATESRESAALTRTTAVASYGTAARDDTGVARNATVGMDAQEGERIDA